VENIMRGGGADNTRQPWGMMQDNGAAEDTRQGNQVADHTTRRGVQKTQHEAIRWGMTTQKWGADDAR
jgi:hypothetical protein